MTDEMKDRIERLQLYEDDDTDRSESAERREMYVDRWGEETVRNIEEIFLDRDGPDGLRTREVDIETSGGDALSLRSDLKSLLRTGRLTYTGDTFAFRPSGECPNAVYDNPHEVPIYQNPASAYTNVAWVDVCTTPQSWVRLMILPFDNPPMVSVMRGLSPSSVERIRDGIQSGAEIPPGALEMERRRIRSFGNVLDADNQEGRNRGVGAYLEDVPSVIGRLIVHD